MSIFDLHDEEFLPGDKTKRALKSDILEYEHFDKANLGEQVFERETKPIWVPYLITLLVALTLLIQLLRLQISQGNFNKILAEGNRVRIREISAPRGLMIDSKNQVLAENAPSYNLEIYPLDLPKSPDEREEFFEKLSEVAGIPKEEIAVKVNQKGILRSEPLILKENMDRDTAMILEVKIQGLTGAGVAKKPIRQYVQVSGLGPLLGYVGKVSQEDLKKYPHYKPSSEIGKEGLELYYEKMLKGTPGIKEVEVDSHGREQRELSESEALPGNNLILSLDSALEKKLANSLSGYIRAYNAPGGAAVALNPKTGQVLAMVSLPSYDNNLFTRQTAEVEYQKLIVDPSKPLFNRVLDGTYPSGSTIKPVVAAAGLDDGIITPLTTINAPAEIKVGNYVYPDWKAHGLTDVRKAIAESVNIFFYAVSGGWDKIKGLGIVKMDDYLKRFGFGAKTGIDLPSEAAGLVPDPEWKERVKHEIWYLGDTYHLGIGQGDFLVTPIQMAVAYGAIVNNGELLQPQLVNKITDKDGKVVKDFEKVVIRKDFISKDALQVVREGMRQTVTSGSGQLLKDLPVATAAKTGTAQFGSEGKTHAWMVAYAPYNNPEIIMIVVVEEGGEGYAAAGPVVKDVFDWYFTR